MISCISDRQREDATQHETCTSPSLVPTLRGKSSKKFAAQTSCGKQDSEHSAEVFQADYMFIRTVAESKTQPCITFVETRGGAVLSMRKGKVDTKN